jgi:tetratricopeptide (TPR) repeat protein
MAEKMGAPRAIALCECFLGAVDFHQGEWERAERVLRESLQRYQEITAAAGESVACQRLGSVLTARGQYEEAMAMLDRARDAAERSTMRAHLVVRAYSSMTENRVSAGDLERARYFLEQGLRALERHGACVSCNALLYPVAVRAYLATGDVVEAEQYGARLKEVAERHGSRGWTAMASQSRGLLAAHRDALEDAADSLQEAVTLFEAIGQPYDAALTMVDLAQVLRRRGAPGDAARAEELLKQAREVFARLGAEPALARVRALLAAA